MKYHLRVYDNYHYADESEAYDYGGYCTYEEAENGAKAIVKEFLELNWSRGITPDKLIASFCMYGEDPIILPLTLPADIFQRGNLQVKLPEQFAGNLNTNKRKWKFKLFIRMP